MRYALMTKEVHDVPVSLDLEWILEHANDPILARLTTADVRTIRYALIIKEVLNALIHVHRPKTEEHVKNGRSNRLINTEQHPWATITVVKMESGVIQSIPVFGGNIVNAVSNVSVG